MEQLTLHQERQFVPPGFIWGANDRNTICKSANQIIFIFVF